MNVREQTLERVAAAITDGLPVGWDAEKAARPELTGSLDVLRQLEVMARTLGETVDDTVALPAQAPALQSWGHLRMVEKIGEGGFGEVHRAHDPLLKVDVALKLFRTTHAGLTEEEFLDEAQRLARVRHPNVLVVHGAGRHQGIAGMWTELLDGQTLETLLERQGPLGAREACTMGIELCGALAAIHGAGLVHRDVKAENVMRERGGRLVLLDFGCGGEIPPGGLEHHSTSIRGTPLAMAPEQLQGRTVGPATDLYGLGVLLYRLVSGRYPIEASSLYELVHKHDAGESVGLRDRRPDLPAEFIRVIEKALAADPARRFQRASEMERALAEAAGITVSVASPAAPAGAGARAPAEKPAWWHRIKGVIVRPAGRLAIATVVMLVAAGVWLSTRRPPPSSEVARPDRAPPTSTAGEATTPVFAVKANLYRARPDGPELLTPGARVQPGDNLFLEIEGTRDFHAYVLAEDRRGKAFVLFPGPTFDSGNPLAAGRVHRLPGTRKGTTVHWQVTSAGGDESVVAIGSLAPLADLERDIATIPKAADGAEVEYGEVSEAAKQQLYRGIGGVASSPSPRDDAPQVLGSIMRTLPGGSKRTDDLWMWQITLSNP